MLLFFFFFWSNDYCANKKNNHFDPRRGEFDSRGEHTTERIVLITTTRRAPGARDWRVNSLNSEGAFGRELDGEYADIEKTETTVYGVWEYTLSNSGIVS